MMANWLRCVLVTALVQVTLSAAASVPDEWAVQIGVDPTVSYQATRVFRGGGFSIEMTERKAPQRQRLEMVQQGMRVVMILREDEGVAYALMPDMGFYQEIPLEQARSQTGVSEADLSGFEKVGSETVNGFACDKYRGTFSSDGSTGVGYIWVADNGVPIKMNVTVSTPGQADQSFSMELTNLKIGAQDPGFFELPAGLQSIQVP